MGILLNFSDLGVLWTRRIKFNPLVAAIKLPVLKRNDGLFLATKELTRSVGTKPYHRRTGDESAFLCWTLSNNDIPSCNAACPWVWAKPGRLAEQVIMLEAVFSDGHTVWTTCLACAFPDLCKPWTAPPSLFALTIRMLRSYESSPEWNTLHQIEFFRHSACWRADWAIEEIDVYFERPWISH